MRITWVPNENLASRILAIIVSFSRNDDGESEDSAWCKMNLYFTRESRAYPDAFSISIGFGTSSS